MTDITPTADVRKLIVECVKGFERDLPEGKEALLTVFVGGAEIDMSLSAVTSCDGGLIVLMGRDKHGDPIDVGVPYSALTYTIRAVESRNPARFGFGGRSET